MSWCTILFKVEELVPAALYTTCLIIVPFLLWRIYFTSSLVYPPGPSADPLIGHARIMPKSHVWKTFAKWGKTFGDLIYINCLGNHMIVLNSITAAKELLDKRGAVYSDRPRLVLYQEMLKLDSIVAFQRYSDVRFKKHRKILQQAFSPTSVISFRPMQLAEARSCLLRLLEGPDEYVHHIERLVSASIMLAVYGHKIESDDDPYLRLVRIAADVVTGPGNPGATVVDIFPILRFLPAWVPGNKIKRFALEGRKAFRTVLDLPYEMVKKEMENGIAKKSIIVDLLQEFERGKGVDTETKELIKCVCGVAFVGEQLSPENTMRAIVKYTSAAVETSTTTLISFVAAMTLNTDVVKQAQREIDDLIGLSRLPEYDDRENLPYLEAILKETLRWNPPGPLGVPHGTAKSDHYEGMYIPKGSTVIPNIWGMFHDEQIYPEPDRFLPERFLEKALQPNGQYDFQSLGNFDPDAAIYGFGRRICPGRFYADAGLWMAMATILACFDILPPLNAHGEPELPVIEFAGGLTSTPIPFKCRITPRSEKHVALIRKYTNEQFVT